ncbi:MAG: S8 family serine peptidase, partial [Clostridiales bacterium]|nr:S8 family serine peptidase [Clostridiales bacterium]
MEYRKSKNSFMRRASVISVLLIAVLMFALVLTLVPPNVANAVLPMSYVSGVNSSAYGEWWMGESFLNIAKLKESVDGWRNDFVYDFEALEKNPVRVAVIDNGMQIYHSLFTGKYNAEGSKYDEEGNLVVTDGIGDYDVFLRDKKGNIIGSNIVSQGSSSGVDDSISDAGKGMHGSHVAGILALLIHTLDLEKYIKLIPIKAANGDTFTSSNFKSAVTFALNNEADVVNMSLSAKTANSSSFDISNSQAERAVFVCAAGNDGKSSSSAKYYPAASPNVIGVMNYQDTGGLPALSSTSNYGSAYDICAPGRFIFSADGSGTNDSYTTISGTSMASPIVAFAAALATLKYRALGDEKTKVEIADIVRNLSSSTLTHKGESFKTLDINLLASGKSADFSAEIKLKDEKLAVQQLGRIKRVEMSLEVLPSKYQGEGTVEWYVGEQKIGEGFSCAYTPPSIVGEVVVKAIWAHPLLEDEEEGDTTVVAQYTLKVEYLKIDGDISDLLDINITTGDGSRYDENSIFRVNSEYVFSINAELLASEDVGNIMWY